MSTALSQKVDKCVFHNLLQLFVLEFLPVSFHLFGECYPESFFICELPFVERYEYSIQVIIDKN